MKTLILYATKYGATKQIAELLAKRLDSVHLHDLEQADQPEISNYDYVIIGSSIYAGSIRKEAKQFMQDKKEQLLNQKFGLFLSGISEREKDKVFETNFSKELRDSAHAYGFLGGIYNPDKVNRIERFIMKVVAKQTEYINQIDHNEIHQFFTKLI